ncbi:stage V sporulation protein S [Jeotgalibacillus proteolyticus]|uniref:Stage V sporulation protein S n=2 Tax=Jeotgalibacillus proteolyticus TaxID=2082395 RepID=A0A2S5G8Y5_9BACL|nr:stage V sporulation protein S [Jeotgalibacillus proteolyticus]
MIKKITLFLSFSLAQKKLLIESYSYLAWARYLKSIPFSKVVPSLGAVMQETALETDPANKKTLGEISQAIHLASKYTFFESQCLVKAIAAMKMLEKRKIESTLYLGTARDEDGQLIAHAWIRSGPFYITGSEGMERFTVVSKFAKNV